MTVVENTDFPLVKLSINEDLAKVDTIGKVFLSKLFSYPDKSFLKYKKYGSFRNISYTETFNSLKSLYIQLKDFGLAKGDRVLFISENRQQLITAALGAALSGFVSIPVNTGYTSAQIQEIIKDCHPKCIFVSNDKQIEKLNEVKDIPVVTFDLVSSKYIFYKDIIKKHKNDDIDFIKIIYEVRPDNTAYILYQYNEQGKQEGIKLSHNNLLSSVKQAYEKIEIINGDDMVLFNMPLSFINGLFEVHFILYSGAVCAVADDVKIEDLCKNTREVNASIFSGTPDIWKKYFNKITKFNVNSGDFFTDTANNALKKGFCWGIIQDHSIIEFFKTINFEIIQFYGHTETAGPYACFNYDSNNLEPFADIEVKIEDSEILIKRLSGYNQNPLINSWFRTGDTGLVNKDGNIEITGKKGDYITLLSGCKVSPQRIENMIKSKFISKVAIVGEKREFLSALIVPDIDYLKEYAGKELKIHYKTTTELLKNRWVKSLYRIILENLNKELASFEKIAGFALLEKPFSIDSTELTSEGKPVREIITIKRNREIESIYKSPFVKLLFETSSGSDSWE